MKDLIRYFISLSASERKGVLLLIIVIMVITGINIFLANHRPPVKNERDSALLKELQLFEQQLTTKQDSSAYPTDEFHEEGTLSAELFYFDPNSASIADLKRLGMNSRLTRTLLNYRLHGGRFHQKEDLKKIYGMSTGLYKRLAPFVNIPEPSPRHDEMKFSKPVDRFSPVDINLADSVALEKLHGIGPVLSKRIVRYRSLLGGFYNTGQLKEVYGLSDSLISIIQPVFIVDTANIIKLNLNLATENELARHPYIGRYTARGIIRYRSTVHKIKSLDELKVNGLVSAENFKKLKKYLTI